MGIRSPFSKVARTLDEDPSAAGLVDMGLGEAYEVVEFVKDNIQVILTLGAMTDKLEAIFANIANFGDYALIGHDHAGVYSLVAHTHDDLYQPIGDYASGTHDHTGVYSPIAHNHDELYQPLGDYVSGTHNHDGVYSPVVHDHDGVYQPVGSYQAAGDYAPAVHNHDGAYLQITQLGAINGVAPLDVNGFIPTSHIPALAISKPSVVVSEAAQLALVAQEGDIAIRSDISQNYIHNGGTAGTMADWTALVGSVSTVSSVNGQQGIVVLAKGDVGLGNVDNTSDANKPISSATQTALNAKQATGDYATNTALNAKAPLASPTFTGTVGGITKGMVGLGNVDNTADASKPVSTAQATAIGAKLDASQKAAVNGVASLGADGKVPAGQLPAATGGTSVTVTDATTAYNVLAADVTNYRLMTNAAAKTATFRPDATEALPANGEWHFRNKGAGNLTLVAGAGVTLYPPYGGTLVVPQKGTVTVKRIAINEFDVMGVTLP
jgi:hypothetical protein